MKNLVKNPIRKEKKMSQLSQSAKITTQVMR